jgi:hypothetical protein
MIPGWWQTLSQQNTTSVTSSGSSDRTDKLVPSYCSDYYGYERYQTYIFLITVLPADLSEGQEFSAYSPGMQNS